MATNGVQEDEQAEAEGERHEESGGAADAHMTHCDATAAFHIHEPTLTQLVEEGLGEAIDDDDDLI